MITSVQNVSYKNGRRWFDSVKFSEEEMAKMNMVDWQAVSEVLWDAIYDDASPRFQNMQNAIMMKRTLTGQAAVFNSDGIATAYAHHIFCKLLMESHVVDVDKMSSVQLQDLAQKMWEAVDQADTVAAQVQSGFGFGRGPSWRIIVKIITRSSPDLLNKISQIGSAAADIYSSVNITDPDDGPQRIVGTETGGELERVDPSVMAQMAMGGVLEDVASFEVATEQAQQTEMEADAPSGIGRLIVLVDESTSMHGERNNYAKAALLALVRLAHDKSRPVHVIHFASATLVKEIPVGDQNAIMAMVDSFLTGGTSIGTALSRAAEVLTTLPAGSQADVVVISDGEDGMWQEQINAIKIIKQKGSRIWTVAIDEDFDQNCPCRQMADWYAHITDSTLTGARGQQVASALMNAAMAKPIPTDPKLWN